MAGMLGIFVRSGSCDPPGPPPDVVHDHRFTDLTEWTGSEGFVQQAVLVHDELGKRVSRSGNLRLWFCGDLPGRAEVPWELFLESVADGRWQRLAALKTPFAAALFDPEAGRAWLVSDRRSQQPLFYRAEADALRFSTHQAAFATSLGGAGFSSRWLYELLYFNYPVLDRSWCRGVRRMPPATVLSWDRASGSVALDRYAEPFARPADFVRGREALERAHEVFSRATADCFRTKRPVAVPLTAGFDSRSVLAFAPPPGEAGPMVFTYGQPGCYDLVEAAGTASRLGLEHAVIPFDEAFAEMLPGLAPETIRLSDGLERVLRATQPYVFSQVASLGRRVVVSGISGDHVFRDHLRGRGNVPALISADFMEYIATGEDHLDDERFRRLLGGRHGDFVAHIRNTLEELRERHGDLAGPEGYTRFLVYENAPKYFAGEAAVAGRSLTYRTPFWDSRVIDLAFTLDRGTVGLSTLQPDKDRFVEAALQAFLVSRSPHYAKAPVKGVSTGTYVRGNKTLYQVEKALRRGPGRLAGIFRKTNVPTLEDWRGWLAGPLGPLVTDLLGPASRLRTRLDPDFQAVDPGTGNLIHLGHLLTAELVLRQIEGGWRKDETTVTDTTERGQTL